MLVLPLRLQASQRGPQVAAPQRQPDCNPPTTQKGLSRAAGYVGRGPNDTTMASYGPEVVEDSGSACSLSHLCHRWGGGAVQEVGPRGRLTECPSGCPRLEVLSGQEGQTNGWTAQTNCSVLGGRLLPNEAVISRPQIRRSGNVHVGGLFTFRRFLSGVPLCPRFPCLFGKLHVAA